MGGRLPEEAHFQAWRLRLPWRRCFFLHCSQNATAGEVVDPRSGNLYLSENDLTVQAGPVVLEVARTFEKRKEVIMLIMMRFIINYYKYRQ